METMTALGGQLVRLFGPLDLAALGLFAVLTMGLTLAIEHPPKRWPSTARLMERHRRLWMEAFAEREVRIFDASLLTTLRQGTAFFASAAMLMIGGVAALLGQADRLVRVVEDLGALQALRPVWEAKLIFIAILLVNGFLKFVWAHRLFGYMAVLMGAVPERASGKDTGPAIERTARLHEAAARSFNRGLRSLYFTIAALAWFAGPVPLMVASLLTALMILRREFWSASRRALTDVSG